MTQATGERVIRPISCQSQTTVTSDAVTQASNILQEFSNPSPDAIFIRIAF
jgi:hypothetical protein